MSNRLQSTILLMENRKKQMKDIPRIWFRKKATLIFALDIDKDGILSYEDAMTVVDRIIKSANLKGAASDNIIQFFRKFMTGYDQANPGIYEKTWEVQLLEVWSTLNSEVVSERLKALHGKLFQTLDFNSDGFIHFSEYIHWWKALGLDPSLARLQFDYMDTDHDGRITEKEFVDAALDYEYNCDNDTKNRFYGPLVDF
ncbi:unnamed protein product [Owenia fusiformis]|uniref:Uncharacterized protein n=1 Tax=Owenia fusiformis TaxID=6347 RepID=A0A8J1XXN1_OWEFU|nr:unnamed protein product [Owenia fusiformis]